MKTLFKLAIGSIIVCCLAIGTALVILHRMFPPEKIQALVLDKLQTASHRQIRLAHVDLGIRGLMLQDLEVSEEPDFKAGTILKAQTLQVRPRLMALLQRRIEVSDVILSGWECRVIHRADGTWNVESSASPSPPPVQAPVAAAGAASAGVAGASTNAWDVDGVRLENGTILYADTGTHAAYALKSIQLSVKHLRPTGSFPMDLSADYSGQGMDGRIELRGTVDLGGLDPAKITVQWDALKLRHLGFLLESSGRIRNLSSPELSLAFSLPSKAWTQNMRLNGLVGCP